MRLRKVHVLNGKSDLQPREITRKNIEKRTKNNKYKKENGQRKYPMRTWLENVRK